jgi:effector-binding domain-containing protein/predicted hydrocarbon binding protein
MLVTKHGDSHLTDAPSYQLKQLDAMLVASIRAPMKSREQLKERFAKIRIRYAELICGPAFIVYHWDTPITDGLDIEAGYPVSKSLEDPEIISRLLPAQQALTTLYKGSYEGISPSFRSLAGYRSSRGLASALNPREVYHTGPFEENPDDNVTEIQDTIHDWENRLTYQLEYQLGEPLAAEILEGHDRITAFSTAEERSKWVISALERLDRIGTEEQKYQIISRCSHVRPTADIEQYRAAFEKHRNIDEFLSEYSKNPAFVEKPYREGKILYMSKQPCNPEEYKKAKTQDEVIKAYCFCPVVMAGLQEMPRTFCYCGAGWTRQLIEGLLGEPVKIDIVSSVTQGGKICKFAVHLPDDVIP